MGILDEVVGALGAGGSSAAPAGGLLGELSSMLAGSGGQGSGVGGLLQQFEQAGLGHVVQSWIGTGQNLPIDPQQLQQVLGPARIQSMAQSTGLPIGQLLSQLAQVLPGLIDHLTPQGQVPASGLAHGDVAGALASVLGRLGGVGAAPA